MKARKWLCIGMCLGLSAAARAAGPGVHFDRLTINDGLSQSTIMSVAQDSKGFMWFGTQDGLNRYDGYDFRIFRPDQNSENSLPDNNIRALYTDADGGIWAGTDGGGLARLDADTLAIRTFRHDGPDSLAQDWITAIAPSSGKSLWVGFRDAGVDLFDPATQQFRHFRPAADSGCGGDVLSLLPLDAQTLWVGTRKHGLCRLHVDTGQWEPVKLSAASGILQVEALTAGAKGRIWVATDNGLYGLGPDGAVQQHLTHGPAGAGQSLSSNDVHALLYDRNGSLWIGTQHGLDRLHPENGRVEQYQSQPGDPTSLSDNNIGSLFQDASGLIWVGTLSNGINKLNLRQEVFHGLSVAESSGYGLSNPVVWSVIRDSDDSLWIGTESGLNHAYPATGRVTHYLHNSDDPQSLSNNNVRDLARDARGHLWLATRGGGLERMLTGGGFRHYRHRVGDPDSLAGDDLLTLLPDGDDGLWVGTAGEGLDYLDFASGKFTHYRHDDADPTSLPQDDVYALAADGDGGYWVGTLAGLSHFDPDTGRFHTWQHEPGDPQSLSNNGVGIILPMPNGTLWVGTDMGLNHFDPATGKFTVYTTSDGLPNDFIYGLVADNDTLWISTNRGLSHFHPDTGKFSNYSMRDGLLSDEFNTGACYRDARGWLYFGSVNGLNYFNPAQLHHNSHAPPVVLTNFKIFDKTVSIADQLRRGDPVRLSYKDSFFSIEFAALDYTVPEQNQYAYKLEGFDRGWVHSGTRHYASYTNLDGGTYRFHVIASNNDGVWNDTGLTIPIVISSPPWATWWAYSIYAALFILVMIAVLRFHSRRGARRLAEKLNTLGRSFNRTLEVDPILERLLEALREFVPFTEARALLLVDDKFEMRATYPATEKMPWLSGGEHALLQRLKDDMQPLAISDPARPAGAIPLDASLRDVQAVVLPLERDDSLLGALILYADRDGSFSPERLNLASTLINQAVTALQNAFLYQEIRRLAVTDELTGLANRRQFFDAGAREVKRAWRYGRPLAMLMIDLDHFKEINDKHGHTVGDTVLRRLGRGLLATLRTADLAARYGGEEFVVLLPECDLEGARLVASRIAREFTEMTCADDKLPEVTLSIGVAVISEANNKLARLIEAADRALYAAKEQGRDRVVTEADL